MVNPRIPGRPDAQALACAHSNETRTAFARRGLTLPDFFPTCYPSGPINADSINGSGGLFVLKKLLAFTAVLAFAAATLA
jgi:hypothetical protein